MEILIVLAIMFISSVIVSFLCGHNSLPIVLIAACSGVALTIAITSLPVSLIESEAEIDAFLETRVTLEHIRQNEELIEEKIAIYTKVVEMNQWLAEQQNKKQNVFGLWISDRIMELEPIR